MEIKHFADTSALLHQKNLIESQAKILISPLTLQELEGIKNNEKESGSVKFQAREVVRAILTTNQFEVITIDNRKIDKMLKKYSFWGQNITYSSQFHLDSISPSHPILSQYHLLRRDKQPQDVAFLARKGKIVSSREAHDKTINIK